MKTCSKCRRTYPDYVDFCLRDGHPLVAEAAAPAPPATPAPVAADAPPQPSADAVPIDVRSTTDAFFPSPSAQAELDASGIRAELAETQVMSAARLRALKDKLLAEAMTPPPGAPSPDLDAEADPPDPGPVGQGISLKSPLSFKPGGPDYVDPQALIQTTLIPRNWRRLIPDAGAEDLEQTPTPTHGAPFDGAEPHTGAEPPAEVETTPTPTARLPEPAARDEGEKTTAHSLIHDSLVTPPLEATPSEEAQGPVLQAAGPHPFVEAPSSPIPSGFEHAAPPEEEDEEENTGSLSQPFIAHAEDGDDLSLDPLPWEAPTGAAAFVPRGQRGRGEIALEEDRRVDGAAPPKGSFRRRAAFSHWPAPPVAEEDDLGGERGASAWRELPQDAVRDADDPPPPTAARPAASPRVAPVSAPSLPEEEVDNRARGRMWMGIAGAALLLALVGLWSVFKPPADPPAGDPAALALNAPPKVAADPPPPAPAPTPSPAPPAATPVKPAATPSPVKPTPPPAKAPALVVAKAPPPAPRPAASPRPAPPAAKASSPTQKPATAPKAQLARLSVTAVPAGAKVAVDGRSWGEAPVAQDLPAGTYTVQVELAGHRTETRQVTLEPEAKVPLKVELVAEAPRAGSAQMLVLVGSNPSGADIFVDGRRIDDTPATLRLGPGTYQVKIVHEGKPPYEESLTIPSTFPTGSRRQVFAQF